MSSSLSSGSGVKAYRLAILGCGTMGTSILTSLLSSPKSSQISHVYTSVRTPTSATRLETSLAAYSDKVTISVGENVKAAKNAEVVILGFKPYMLRGVLGVEGMREALKGKFVISLLAGVKAGQVREALGLDEGEVWVRRAVPNVAASVGASITVLGPVEDGVKEEWARLSWEVFEAVGRVVELSEALMDVATVVVGAGIAVTTVLVDGMLDGCVAEGIPRKDALQIVAQCLVGTGLMLQGNAEGEGAVHPSVLRESVSSPRGCTIRALMEVERRGVRSAAADSITIATDHVKGMGAKQD